MAKKMTRPLKITCHLLDGRINSADGLIFLDAILYHAWFLRHMPEVFDGLVDAGQVKHVGLPLTQLPNNRYKATCGFYREYDQQVEHWTRKPNLHGLDAEEYADFAGKRGKVNQSAGEHRAYRVPNVIRTVGPIEFYAVGNPKEVEDMLNLIKYLGKKPAMGWGNVRQWTVEEIEEDYTTMGPYGLMRPIPADELDFCGDEYLIRSCGIRPPYWKPVNQVPCYVPNVVIV